MLANLWRKFGALVASAGRPRVRAGGRVWHLSSEGETLFGPSGPDLDAWLANGSSEIVKSGAHRTVYRVRLPSGVLYVKHCRINGPRAWAREIIRVPKARLEFEHATLLRALGLGAAAPLAWGTADTRWPGESFLVTRDLAPAAPLPEFADGLSPHELRALTRELGAFVARLHENGVAHPDPHPGNLLVQARPTPPAPLPAGRGEEGHSHALSECGARDAMSSITPLPAGRGAGGVGSSQPLAFALLDVHAIRFGPPLPRADSRANLVLLNRWFQLRATRADRARFWRAYCAARPALALGAREAKELEGLTLASNRRFWLARTARYAGTHRTVRKVRAGRVRGLAVRDLSDGFLRALLANPDALFTQPGTKILKDCLGSTVAEILLPASDGTRTVILKRVNAPGWFAAVKNLFRSSSVRRSWLLGHGLCERHLPTPRPLAVLHQYRAGFLPAEGYLLTEKVPDAVGLTEAVRACRDPHTLRVWAERLARVVRTMHGRGVSHRDLKAPNVMLAGAARDPATATPVLIDLVGVRAGADAVPFARCAKELARLNASFLMMPHVTRTERLRFLRAYLRAGAGGTDWKAWWRAVYNATRAKVAKNRRRGRSLA